MVLVSSPGQRTAMSPMASSVPVDSSDEEDTECFGSGRAAVLLVFASADADADAFLQPIQVCELAWFDRLSAALTIIV